MTQEIKSRFSLEIIITTLLIPLFTGGVSVGCLWGLLKNTIPNGSIFDIIFRSIFLMFLFAAFIASILFFIQNISKIAIYPNGIQFKSLLKTTFLSWNDILYISLADQKGMSLVMMYYDYDSVCIQTKEGERYFIPYRFYSNYVRLIKVIEKVETIKKQGDIKTISLDDFSFYKPKPYYPEIIEGEKYKGKLFKTPELYILAGIGLLMGGMAIILSIEGPTLSPLFLLFILPFFYWILASSFYYCVLAKDYIMLKNILLFWKKKIVALEEIKVIRIEEPFRSPITLKIITKDFIVNAYPCDGINKKVWLELIETLENKKVSVQVTAIL